MATLKILLLLSLGFLPELYLCVRSSSIRDGIGFKQLTERFEEIAKDIETPPGCVSEKYFKARVDNSNHSDSRTWMMRYFERLDLFSNDGPIYIYFGGEGWASGYSLEAGLVYEIAKDTGGALFATEHRYYGESLPLGNRNNMPLREYYKYLSSRQALADIAAFVEHLKKKPQFINSKVVVTGGSYAGNLAAWFRLLYPKLADAALASSAPVQALADFPGYFETVTDDYRRLGSQQCVDKIHKKFQTIAQKYKSSRGIDTLKEEYNICPDSSITGLFQYIFLSHVIDSYVGAIQYGKYKPIHKYCSNSDDTDHFINSAGCTEYSLDDYYKPGAWYYQLCTEFGYFMTTDSNKQMFWGVPTEFGYQDCKSTFGIEEEEVNKSIRETNEYYGGKNINASKVLFVYGQNDPWHTLGVLKPSKLYNYEVILVANASHCQDLDAHNKVLADKEKKILRNWIGM